MGFLTWISFTLYRPALVGNIPLRWNAVNRHLGMWAGNWTGGIMRHLKSLVIAIGIAVGAATLSAPMAVAKEPKNYSWNDIQVITATPGCGNEIWTSRYDPSGKLLGSKRLLRAARGVQATPYELDYRTSQRPRNFLFSTFDCNMKKSRLYTWDIANSKSRPRLIVDLPTSDTLFDAAYDPASQNVVYLRWGPNSSMTVEMLAPSGGPTTQLWNGATSNVALAPTKLLMDTGGEFSLLGRPAGAGLQDSWVRLQLNSRLPMAQGAVTASGPGQIESATTGGFKLFERGDLYTASGSRAWLCASPPTAVLVTEDRNCVAFRPVANRFPGSRASWSFGAVRNASSFSALLYWWGDGQNYVQPIGVDPTGKPTLGPLTALRGGPGQTGSHLIPGADFDRALDALKIKVAVVN